VIYSLLRTQTRKGNLDRTHDWFREIQRNEAGLDNSGDGCTFHQSFNADGVETSVTDLASPDVPELVRRLALREHEEVVIVLLAFVRDPPPIAGF
jgi:hypothetical protein